MRSRFLIGVGAWVLGATAATTGSLYAVDQLGQDLLVQQSKQVSVTMVNSELALENAEHRTSLPAASPRPPPSAKPPHVHAKDKPTPTPTPSSDPGSLLTTADGTAVATCQQGLAYLVYVSPYNGFEADHVVRGPAAVTGATFRDSSGNGIVLKVSCRAGLPHPSVSPLPGWHDE